MNPFSDEVDATDRDSHVPLVVEVALEIRQVLNEPVHVNRQGARIQEGTKIRLVIAKACSINSAVGWKETEAGMHQQTTAKVAPLHQRRQCGQPHEAVGNRAHEA